MYPKPAREPFVPTYEEYVEKKEKAGKPPLAREEWERRIGLTKKGPEVAVEELQEQVVPAEEVVPAPETPSLMGVPPVAPQVVEEAKVDYLFHYEQVLYIVEAKASSPEPLVVEPEPPGPTLPITVSGGLLVAKEDMAFRKLTAALNYIKRNSNEKTWDLLKVATVHLAHFIKGREVGLKDLETSILAGLAEASKGAKARSEVAVAIKSAQKYCLKLVAELGKR